MNILLVYTQMDAVAPSRPLEAQMSIQLGLSYIAAVLKQLGHQVELLVMCHASPMSELDRCIRQSQPELICFTAVFSEHAFVTSVAQYARAKCPKVFLICGGPHVSLNPEVLLESPFDAICRGEGEMAMVEMVGQLQKGHRPSGIKNTWVKEERFVERNEARPYMEDLDRLPFPDRAMWQRWIQNRDTPHTILLGRGCPYPCTYCCNHAFSRLAEGKYVRMRSPISIAAEIDALRAENARNRRYHLETEALGLDMPFSSELCKRLQEYNRCLPEPLEFSTNLRIVPGQSFDALLRAMKAANFTEVNVGLESGSPRIRREMLNRHYSNDDYLRTVARAHQYGLRVCTYVMLGIPGETKADLRETVRCLRQSQPDDLSASIFFPYPGTVLYAHCADHGLLPANLDTRFERCIARLDLPGLARRRIQREFDWLYYHVYRGVRPWSFILNNIKPRRFRSNIWNDIGHLLWLLERGAKRLVEVLTERGA